MTFQVFIAMCARAWSLTVLALIDAGTPARTTPLAAAAQASRAAIAASLERLRVLGLVSDNQGHGHPLRPAVQLSSTGRVAALGASRLLAIIDNESDRQVLRRVWTLPLLLAIDEPVSFGELRRRLAPITDRALSQALKTLIDKQWVIREWPADSNGRNAHYVCTAAGTTLRTSLASWVTLPWRATRPQRRD
ncbi:MAG: winged helix-turn-helix transcriptional regulator [Pseudomonadota bacterium]